MSLRNSFLATYFYGILQKLILPFLEGHVKNPNQYTFIGLALAGLVPFGFYLHPVLGLLFMVLSAVADAADGAVARNEGTQSVYGAFLDSSADRASDFFYLTGFWILFWNSNRLILASTLVFLSMFFSLMISYVKARGEALGSRCDVGFLERGWRTLYLIGWALFICVLPTLREILLWSGLILFCVLTLVTVIQRITFIKGHLS